MTAWATLSIGLLSMLDGGFEEELYHAFYGRTFYTSSAEVIDVILSIVGDVFPQTSRIKNEDHI